MTLTKAIILDLDNVLFDSRILDLYMPTDKNSREQWTEFEQHYVKVTNNQWAVDLVNVYRRDGYTILFVTSREDINNCRGVTLNSIYSALSGDLNFVWLFMRHTGDFSPSPDVKKDIYLNEIKDNFDVHLAIDDDRSNCEMYKELGLNVMQVLV
jgi:predicted secreted acid phosphatase